MSFFPTTYHVQGLRTKDGWMEGENEMRTFVCRRDSVQVLNQSEKTHLMTSSRFSPFSSFFPRIRRKKERKSKKILIVFAGESPKDAGLDGVWKQKSQLISKLSSSSLMQTPSTKTLPSVHSAYKGCKYGAVFHCRHFVSQTETLRCGKRNSQESVETQTTKLLTLFFSHDI